MSALREALRELPDAVFADVLESPDAYLLVLDLPGVSADDVTVSASGTNLTITAERHDGVPEGFEPVRTERASRFHVELPLPPTVVGSDAEASMDHGVLELTLPKASRDASTTIPVEDG